jgi:N-acetylneuraminate synthase
MTGVYIIAEAGVNHNGSLDLALQLVDVAKECGADAIKFQTFRATQLVTRTAIKAAYQNRTTEKTESQFEMLQRLELGQSAHRQIIERCRLAGIQFLSSPFDEESADLLESMDLALFKVPSGEITNLRLLRHIASKKKPIILSTGMSTLGEVEEAIQVIKCAGVHELTLLHCVTEYPAPYDEVNLRAMQTMKTAFDLPVGYSDHTPGTEVAVAAVALGAMVIEKHFTLDRSLPGPDHSASLEPPELKQMISAIRHVEQALGDGIKTPAACEIPNILVARKSIISARWLAAGHRIAEDDLVIKRPGTGISPKFAPELIGRTLHESIAEDSIIRWDQLS